MSSALEARFRVQAPNSRPRAVKVIALDTVSRAVLERLAGRGWAHATFLSALDTATIGDDASLPSSWLVDLGGTPRDLYAEVNSADLVVFIAGPGGRAHAASIIGEACSQKRVMTTAAIVGASSASDEALSHTLAQVRPWSLMVVIADTDEYLDDMLTALRA